MSRTPRFKRSLKLNKTIQTNNEDEQITKIPRSKSALVSYPKTTQPKSQSSSAEKPPLSIGKSLILTADFFRIDALDLAPRLLGKLLRREDVVLQITEVEAYRPNDTACHGRFGITARTAPVFGPGGHAYVYLCYGLHTMLNVVADEEGVGAAVLIRSCAPISVWSRRPCLCLSVLWSPYNAQCCSRRGRSGCGGLNTFMCTHQRNLLEIAYLRSYWKGLVEHFFFVSMTGYPLGLLEHPTKSPDTCNTRTSHVPALPRLETIQKRRGQLSEKPVLLTGPGKVGQALGLSTEWSNHPLYAPGGLEILDGPEPEKVLVGPRVGIKYASPEHVNALWRFAVAGSPWISSPKNTLRPP